MSDKSRVLVMDDERMVREMLADMLDLLGYSVDCVVEGRAALEAYAAARDAGDPYDAVILDLTIPGGMGGLETLAELKKLDPDVCAVVSSGTDAGNGIEGFRASISKPYDMDRLESTLAGLLAG